MAKKIIARKKVQKFLNHFTPAHQELILQNAVVKKFKTGQFLAHTGNNSSGFFVIESGIIQLNIQKALSIQTLTTGAVIGWSCILPPHKWAFDIQALSDCETLFVDGSALKKLMKSDPTFGYEVMKVFFKVMTDRLKHSRLQLLDLYKNPEIR